MRKHYEAPTLTKSVRLSEITASSKVSLFDNNIAPTPPPKK